MVLDGVEEEEREGYIEEGWNKTCEKDPAKAYRCNTVKL